MAKMIVPDTNGMRTHPFRLMDGQIDGIALGLAEDENFLRSWRGFKDRAQPVEAKNCQ